MEELDGEEEEEEEVDGEEDGDAEEREQEEDEEGTDATQDEEDGTHAAAESKEVRGHDHADENMYPTTKAQAKMPPDVTTGETPAKHAPADTASQAKPVAEAKMSEAKTAPHSNDPHGSSDEKGAKHHKGKSKSKEKEKERSGHNKHKGGKGHGHGHEKDGKHHKHGKHKSKAKTNGAATGPNDADGEQTASAEAQEQCLLKLSFKRKDKLKWPDEWNMTVRDGSTNHFNELVLPKTGLEASLTELRPLLGSNLKVLHLAGNGGVVGSVEVLTPCVNLTACRLGFSNVRGDLSVFTANMPHLVSLMLGGCPSISGDVGDVGTSLVQLEELSLWRTGVMGDVGAFRALTKLRECYLGGCIGLKGDVAAFGVLPSLKVLDVAGTQCGGSLGTRGGALKLWVAESNVTSD